MPPTVSEAIGAAVPPPVVDAPVDVDSEDFTVHLHVEDVGVAIVEERSFLATPLTLDESCEMDKERVDVLEGIAFWQFATDFGVIGGLCQAGVADGRFIRRHLLLRRTRKDEVVEVFRRPQTLVGLEEVKRVDGVAGASERGQAGEATDHVDRHSRCATQNGFDHFHATKLGAECLPVVMAELVERIDRIKTIY